MSSPNKLKLTGKITVNLQVTSDIFWTYKRKKYKS